MGASSGAGAGGGGGGRAGRALRLLLLVVLTLAAVEYLFGSILDASPIRTYLYTPLYNATLPSSSKLLAPWPKRLQETTDARQTATVKAVKNATHTEPNNITSIVQKQNPTFVDPTNIVAKQAVTDSSVMLTKIISTVNSNRSNNNNFVTTENNEIKKNETELPLCENLPPDLGPVSANKSKMKLEEVGTKYPEVQEGGMYAPPNCSARHKVAIIVPFRDRNEHLAIFLNHMHPFLMKQQIEYGIFIVEQSGNQAFNRAKLMNVGFVESQKVKDGGWKCFIFHDIDLLPLDQRNMYSCPKQPRHMSASIDKLHFRLPYEEIFGGVSAMTLDQFTSVNGFSNKYWGWGGEDDDMFYRLKRLKYHIARYKMSIARYAMLDHKKSTPNPKRYQLLSQTSKTFQKDGLSTLKYQVVKVTKHHLYTHVLANIDERS